MTIKRGTLHGSHGRRKRVTVSSIAGASADGSSATTIAQDPSSVGPAEEGHVLGSRGRNPLTVLVPIVTLIAVIALGVAAAGLLINRPKSDAPLRAEIHRLQDQLASQQAAITTIKANSQANTVSSLQGQMQKLLICLPEMQQEINGMSVSTDSNSGWLTDAYLSNPTIISSNCGKTLNGQ